MSKPWRTIECRTNDQDSWRPILEHTMVPIGEAKGAWKVFKAMLPRTRQYRLLDQDGNVLEVLMQAKAPMTQ